MPENVNLTKALALASLGFAVFPCHSSGPKFKTPKTSHGYLDAIGLEREAEIRAWWAADPDALVAIATDQDLSPIGPVVCDIDMDAEKGKDGWDSLITNGLDDAFPKTVTYRTHSGGDHYLYLRPAGAVGIHSEHPYRLPDGRVLPDVDRKADGGYLIWWGDVPASIEEFAEAPAWLLGETKKVTAAQFEGDVERWLNSLPPAVVEPPSYLNPNPLVIEQLPPYGQLGYPAMRRAMLVLVANGAIGLPGAGEALAELHRRWLEGVYDTQENRTRFANLLVYTIQNHGGSVPEPEPQPVEPQPVPELAVPSKLEQDVATHVHKLRVEREAARLLAAEDYMGSRELTWEDLERASQSYIVQDLVPDDAVVFLVAKRNMGKSFCYIDMVGHCATGMPWLGKATRPVKTMIILGEGINGYIDRLKAWCAANGKEEAEIRRWLSFRAGANLNNDTFIEEARVQAERDEVELIIVDTWATGSGVQSEDDAALNSTTLNRALTIKPGATLFFVHHPRKSDQDKTTPVMRGSGAMDGRADVVMTLWLDEKYHANDGVEQKWMALSTDNDHAGKNRTAETETIHGLYLAKENDSAVFRQHRSEAVSAAALKVREHLVVRMTASEFARRADLPKATAHRYLGKAEKEGIAERTPAPHKNEADMWELTAKGKPGRASLAHLAESYAKA